MHIIQYIYFVGGSCTSHVCPVWGTDVRYLREIRFQQGSDSEAILFECAWHGSATSESRPVSYQ